MLTIAILSPTTGLANHLSDSLMTAGYQVRALLNLDATLSQLATHRPDLLLVDLGRGNLSHLALIRAADATLPILALSRAESEPELVAAYAAGVDDYQVVRTPSREIVARIGAILRRLHLAPLDDYRFADGLLRVTRGGNYVVVRGRWLHLVGHEWHVVTALARAGGTCRSSRELARALGRVGDASGRNMVNQVVWHLRRKLDPDAPDAFIETMVGGGYRLKVAS